MKKENIPDNSLEYDELKIKIRKIILNIIKRKPIISFLEDCLWFEMYPYEWRKRLGENFELGLQTFKEVVKEINSQAKCFVVNITEDGRIVKSTEITLRTDKEWDQAYREAWDLSGKQNPHYLTDGSFKLWQWLQPNMLSSEWIKETQISWKAGLSGGLHGVEDHLNELKQKCCLGLNWKTRGERWEKENPLEYHFWIEKNTPDQMKESSALNPVLDYEFHEFKKKDLDACRDLVHNLLLEQNPQGKDDVLLIGVNTQQTYQRIFPNLNIDSWEGEKLKDFFDKLPIVSGIDLYYDFESDSFWYIIISPVRTWKTTLKQIQEFIQSPSLKERYGLSKEASKLLEWIEGLRPKEYFHHWTPVVEEELEQKIGLECPWEDDQNFQLYLQILLEEINEKTPYDLSLQPWKDRMDVVSRIRVDKKKTDEQKLIHTIQMYCLSKDKFVKIDEIRERLSSLLNPQS